MWRFSNTEWKNTTNIHKCHELVQELMQTLVNNNHNINVQISKGGQNSGWNVWKWNQLNNSRLITKQDVTFCELMMDFSETSILWNKATDETEKPRVATMLLFIHTHILCTLLQLWASCAIKTKQCLDHWHNIVKLKHLYVHRDIHTTLGYIVSLKPLITKSYVCISI